MIFVDTNVWLCIWDDRQNPSDSRRVKEFFRNATEPFATSDLIVAETYKWLLHKERHLEMRFRVLDYFVSRNAAAILPIDGTDRRVALELLRKFSDQSLSFEDAMSVALMHRFGIKKIFSLDKDFLLFPEIVRVP